MRSNRWVTAVKATVALVGVSLVSLVGPIGVAVSSAAVNPPWEPDPNAASPYGNLVFYDATGNVLAGGTNLSHLADYVAATTAGDAGATKATLSFAAPNHANPTSLWTAGSASASTSFPNSSRATPIQGPGFTKPVVTLAAADANLTAFLGGVTLDSTAGYANIIEVRMKDSGPLGVTSGSHYWNADIAYNDGGSPITVDGVVVAAGSWAQLYPTPPTATTTGLGSSTNPSVVGQSVTYTATVSPTPDGGTVAFKDGLTTIAACATQPLTSGIATCIATPSTAGTHSITAVYSGDAGFTGSTSTALSQTVNQAATTTALGSTVNPSVVGQATTYTATITVNSPGAGTPSGTVAFKDGGTTITTCAAQPVAAGTATCTTSPSTAGSHSITAVYSGDTNFAGSTAVALTQTVDKAATSTALGSSINPSAIGQSVTYTATVTVNSPGAGAPTGTVAFKDGSTTISTCTGQTVSTGTATCAVTYGSTGSHSITAVYSGDTNFAGSTSTVLTQTVVAAITGTTLGSSANPSVTGQQVTYTATVSPTPDGGTVAFKDGGSTIGTCSAQALTGATATCATTYSATGSHTITAVYSGDANFGGSTSAPLTQTVNKASTGTALGSSTNPSVTGQSVTYTATITVTSPGAGTPTGTVAFKDGGATITTCSTQAVGGGVATCVTTPSPVGSHTITAVYSGDANFATSTSAALTQTVDKASTGTALGSSTNPSVTGQSVTYTATVTVTSPGAGTPTGTVAFKDGGATIAASLGAGRGGRDGHLCHGPVDRRIAQHHGRVLG